MRSCCPLHRRTRVSCRRSRQPWKRTRYQPVGAGGTAGAGTGRTPPTGAAATSRAWHSHRWLKASGRGWRCIRRRVLSTRAVHQIGLVICRHGAPRPPFLDCERCPSHVGATLDERLFAYVSGGPRIGSLPGPAQPIRRWHDACRAYLATRLSVLRCGQGVPWRTGDRLSVAEHLR